MATINETILAVRDLYEEAELELLRILVRQLDEGKEVDANAWVKRKLASIKPVRQQLIAVISQLKKADDNVAQQILDAFLQGSANNPTTNEKAVQAFIKAYTDNATTSRFQILRSTQDIYRRVLQQVAGRGVIGIETRKQLAKRALTRFTANGITGFYTKDGKQWDMTSYSEMATRTTLNNSYREGRLASNENDLVIVRAGPRHCEICDPWANKILSVSGSSNKYPSLAYAKSKGLFHPNCRCSISNYVPGLTKVDTNELIDNNYEQEQVQRKLERDIRKYKRALVINPDNETARAKLKEKQASLTDLVDSENLTRKRNRESLTQAR